MFEKRKLIVNDQEIGLDEDYVNLTDIAKQNGEGRPDTTISSWLKNSNTLRYLEEWELQNNPNFKPKQMLGFRLKATDNRNSITPKRYVDETNAIGFYAKPGRGGATFAHIEIAIMFCYWLSPPFAVWMVRSFKTLVRNEVDRQNLEFHISRLTDTIDEARNWLDTIPGQQKERNRMLRSQEEEQGRLEEREDEENDLWDQDW